VIRRRSLRRRQKRSAKRPVVGSGARCLVTIEDRPPWRRRSGGREGRPSPRAGDRMRQRGMLGPAWPRSEASAASRRSLPRPRCAALCTQRRRPQLLGSQVGRARSLRPLSRAASREAVDNLGTDDASLMQLTVSGTNVEPRQTRAVSCWDRFFRMPDQ